MNLKDMAAYDAVPTHNNSGKISQRLFYVTGSSVSFKRTGYGEEKWVEVEAGTNVTEYRDNALVCMGQIFVVHPNNPMGVNARGKLILLMDTRIEVVRA